MYKEILTQVIVYFCTSLLLIAIGYTWAAIKYLPKIDHLEQELRIEREKENSNG